MVQKKKPTLSKKLEKDRKYHARVRATDRDIAKIIDKAIMKRNMRRRGRCKNNPERFLKTYFPHVFYNPFTSNQRIIISAIVDRILQGGCQAISAERAGGKSSITKGLLLWGILYGHTHWAVVVESEASKSYDTTDDILMYLDIPNADDPIGTDFPEAILPIRLLEGNGMRARTQTYNNVRTRLSLMRGKIIFPTIPGSVSSGAVIQGYGADQSPRGIVRVSRRPDVVILNDVETNETARSPVMTSTIKKNVETGYMGLAGPDKGLSILMLGSIIEKNCLCDIYTDRKKNPHMNGIRLKFVDQWPERMDLWDQYLTIREMPSENPEAASTEFYRENRAEMDRGSLVNSPYRFDKRVEISSLQHAFNMMIRMGKDNFMAEYQGEPADLATNTASIDVFAIRSKMNGLERGVLPKDTLRITAFVDVHDARLFWAVCAWGSGLIGNVIDYGVEAVSGPVKGTLEISEQQKQIEIAVGDALRLLHGRFDLIVPAIDYIGIDAGYLPSVVYSILREIPGQKYLPMTGASSRVGGYVAPKVGGSHIRMQGQGYHQSWQPEPRLWLTQIDSVLFKRRVQSGFLASSDQPGSLSLFGMDPSIHRAIAEHIAAEVYNSEKKKFDKIRSENHWLDCLSGCYALASMLGMKISSNLSSVSSSQKVKVSDLQRARRAAR